ncbi:mucin-2-like [Condylostylus longicornis]|uniref:mucin-2-like n=1 Tax=Condylostylus longicornis TaxID=2530218 RepID=UPI00244E195D|nr:mucin-2-like [Condylostylus longicornis]
MKILLTVLILFFKTLALVNGECDVCGTANIACVNATSFKICVNGEIFLDQTFTCPNNLLCNHDDEERCVEIAKEPSCARYCGSCNPKINIACLNHETFSICLNSKPSNVIGKCENGLVCDTSTERICVNPLETSSCPLPSPPTSNTTVLPTTTTEPETTITTTQETVTESAEVTSTTSTTTTEEITSTTTTFKPTTEEITTSKTTDGETSTLSSTNEPTVSTTTEITTTQSTTEETTTQSTSEETTTMQSTPTETTTTQQTTTTEETTTEGCTSTPEEENTTSTTARNTTEEQTSSTTEITTTTTTLKPTTPPSEATLFCQRIQYVGKFSKPNSCRSYYQCKKRNGDFIGIENRCPLFMSFDCRFGICSFICNNSCGLNP